MPRIAGVATPKYRKHRASGNAIVTLSSCDHYLGPYGSVASRKEYDRVIREWYASGGALLQDKRDEITIVELLAAFWSHAKEHYGPDSTEPHNYSTLIKRLRKAYGPTLVREFGPLRMKAFRDLLVAEKLSRTTINHSVNRVRRIVKWGIENELVHPDVLAALKCVAGLRYGKGKAKETEPVRPVSDACVDAALPHCSPQLAAMVELQRITGMRSGEIVRMRTADINTSSSIWTYTPAKHKTMYRGHTRVVYLGPKAQAVVREWLRSDLQAYLFQPAEAEQWRREQQHAKRKTPLSCGNKPGSNRKAKPRRKPGKGYTPTSYGRAVLYACERAFGLPAELKKPQKGETVEQRKARLKSLAAWRAKNAWHPHQLRHSAATRYRREYGLEVARVLLGHKSMIVTQVYAEADTQRAVEVMGKIG